MSRTHRPNIPLILATALLAVAAAGCPVTQSQDTPVAHSYHSDDDSGAKYYLYVPSTYDPARAWPLAVTLHGTHGFDSARKQIRAWKALAEEHGFIVLAPKLASPQGILPVFQSRRRRQLELDEQHVLAAMDEVGREYNLRRDATLITGFSAGGYALYHLAVRNPERFDVLVARACNADMDILKPLPITDAVRRMPMLIFFSKTGHPVSSNLNPIAKESWAAYRHFRLAECYGAEIKAVEGGHIRHPERAVQFWLKYWPKG